MTTKNDDGLEIPAVLKRQPKAKPAVAVKEPAMLDDQNADAVEAFERSGPRPMPAETPEGRLASAKAHIKGKRKAAAKKAAKAKVRLPKVEAVKARKAAAKAKAVHINDLAKSDNPIAKANAKSWDAVTKQPRLSKQAAFVAAMQTKAGISIGEAAERFGWQKHTVRGAVAGALRKKLGLKIEATKDDERGTVYRIK